MKGSSIADPLKDDTSTTFEQKVDKKTVLIQRHKQAVYWQNLVSGRRRGYVHLPPVSSLPSERQDSRSYKQKSTIGCSLSRKQNGPYSLMSNGKPEIFRNSERHKIKFAI
jgi:hypothetical protein